PRQVDQIKVLAPFEAGSKILAHVVNYYGHDKEAKVKVPAKPFFFQKPASSVANPGDPIIAHSASSKLDHEIEIAIVIGRAGRNIAPQDALAHVAGYSVLNDVSYRDFQMNDGYPDLNTSYGKNWTQAKGLDGACPMGPVLVLVDEMPEPYPLRKTCRVNGVLRQDASSADMIHKVPALIAEVSKGMTLWPGDVIATGTPAGGGLGDGVWLKPGDVVECEVENIGVLRSLVMADTAAV
ncbi:MAG: fumarylacetoacetate hydrolase family protein, partial [Gemmatimonadaceae bacterium]|nr:fumarylacetoacetate hydrolase family protein [Acetobacteraceae bacterium]